MTYQLIPQAQRDAQTILLKGYNPSAESDPSADLWTILLTTNAIPAYATDPDTHAGLICVDQVLAGNGWAGYIALPAFTLPTYDAVDDRAEATETSVTITASGGDVAFQGWVVVRNHHRKQPVAVTLSGQTFSATGHGFIAGDRVAIGGTTLPTGYTAGTMLLVSATNLTANSFECTTLAGAATAFSTAGTSLTAFPAKGSWGCPAKSFDSPVVVLAGSDHTLRVSALLRDFQA